MFDKGFRKAHKNISDWFNNFISHPAVIKRIGKIKMCDSAIKPAGAGGQGKPAAAPKAAAPK